MDILEDFLSMSHLRRWKRVDLEPEVRHCSLAHFLLVSDAIHGKQTRLLLSNGERRRFGTLSVCFAIKCVSGKYHMKMSKKIQAPVNVKETYPIVHGGMPSSWNRVTSPTQISSRRSNGMMAAVSATSTQIDRESGSNALCSQLEASWTFSMVIK